MADIHVNVFNVNDYANDFGERIVRRIYERGNPLDDLNDNEFISRYRFSKHNFMQIVNIFRRDLERPTRRSNALEPEQCMLLALRLYASGSFLEVIGDSTVGATKSTVSKLITSVSTILCQRMNEFVNFLISLITT